MIRLDSYSPQWALQIVEDLEDGCTGREAVQRAVAHLAAQAENSATKAVELEAKAAKWHAARGVFICAETMEREATEHAQEHRQWEGYYRTVAMEAAKLKGEYIAIARLLR